jgi:hypothetical protein
MSGRTIWTGAGVAAGSWLLACGMAQAAEPRASEAQAQEVSQAQEAPVQPAETAGQPAPAKKKWEFATIGYIWFAGAWGKTDVIGPVEPVDLDLPFGKVLKAFKFAFMGAAEAKHDRLIVLGDLTFIHLDAHKGIGIRDPDFLTAELDSRTAEVTLLGGYRVVDDDPVKVDLLAGGRMNWFKTSLQLKGPNRSASGSVKESWFDPILAARVQAPLGGKWSFSGYGDIGGFGIGSDFTWQAVATVNYQINHKMSIGAGWRHFKINYDHGDFLYNVYQTGPLITFRTVL